MLLQVIQTIVINYIQHKKLFTRQFQTLAPLIIMPAQHVNPID